MPTDLSEFHRNVSIIKTGGKLRVGKPIRSTPTRITCGTRYAPQGQECAECYESSLLQGRVIFDRVNVRPKTMFGSGAVRING
jgi:hypothetical protein